LFQLIYVCFFSFHQISGDRVWYDTNLNGEREVGEVGVGGITVYLLNGTTGMFISVCFVFIHVCVF